MIPSLQVESEASTFRIRRRSAPLLHLSSLFFPSFLRCLLIFEIVYKPLLHILKLFHVPSFKFFSFSSVCVFSCPFSFYYTIRVCYYLPYLVVCMLSVAIAKFLKSMLSALTLFVVCSVDLNNCIET